MVELLGLLPCAGALSHFCRPPLIDEGTVWPDVPRNSHCTPGGSGIGRIGNGSCFSSGTLPVLTSACLVESQVPVFPVVNQLLGVYLSPGSSPTELG